MLCHRAARLQPHPETLFSNVAHKHCSVCICCRLAEAEAAITAGNVAHKHCSVCICCRLAEAEAAITAGNVSHKHRNILDDIITEFGDSASFALSLLGNIYW